ncbi:HEPN/Toprim-associated domain-containing protein [Pseudomonas shirazensis]|uniref:HEPN/Toprim-associated domain-containing protein n=1 Tax=Pseudomonas shirazensis TaxID=2745494 RepID=UPI003986B1BF
MGSIVSLTIGGIEIDWGKNNGFINHSKLFLPTDKTILSEREHDGRRYINYGYRRELRSVIPRLELYGYSAKTIQKIWDEHLSYYPDYYPKFELSFEQFAKAIKNITIIPRPGLDEGYDYDLGEFAQEMLNQPEYEELKNSINSNSKDLLSFFENLDPYIQLWLLSTNPKNQSLYLEWHTDGIINGGWTTDEDLFKNWTDDQTFLIITEGSSDTFVIQEAINLLRPDIKDFFTYIDMTEHYPFTGTGNLFNFYKGLAKIGIKNKCLIIFDNDTEGVEKHDKCQNISSPPSLVSMTLPALHDFESMETIGPNGAFKANINGSAVSIECFLDLSYRTKKPASIRWASFNKEMNRYQGALEGKEFYIAQFKKSLKNPDGYDFSKLHSLINKICEKCISISNYGT